MMIPDQHQPYQLSIDGPLLRRQRALLIALADDAHHNRSVRLGSSHAELLEGLIELIDAIADQARDEHGIDCLLPDADAD